MKGALDTPKYASGLIRRQRWAEDSIDSLRWRAFGTSDG